MDEIIKMHDVWKMGQFDMPNGRIVPVAHVYAFENEPGNYLLEGCGYITNQPGDYEVTGARIEGDHVIFNEGILRDETDAIRGAAGWFWDEVNHDWSGAREKQRAYRNKGYNKKGRNLL